MAGLERLCTLLVDTCAVLPQIVQALPDAYEALAQGIEIAKMDKTRSVLFRNTLSMEVSPFRYRKGADASSEFLLPATDKVPKGLAPFLLIHIRALKHGTPVAKTKSAVKTRLSPVMTSTTALPSLPVLLETLRRQRGYSSTPGLSCANSHLSIPDRTRRL